jgi:hypothetical protein
VLILGCCRCPVGGCCSNCNGRLELAVGEMCFEALATREGVRGDRWDRPEREFRSPGSAMGLGWPRAQAPKISMIKQLPLLFLTTCDAVGGELPPPPGFGLSH